MFQLCAGFVFSQVLLACVRLRLLDLLAEGPRDLDTIAARLSLPVRATACLLESATALRLVSRRLGGRFGVGPLGAALVGNPGLVAMIEHHAHVYNDLRDPVGLLRGAHADTALAGYWPYAAATHPAQLSDAAVADYSGLMAASQPLVAAQVTSVYPFRRHRCLLDVGGGDGAFLTAVAAVAPQLRLMLFDLPAVASRAQQRFAAAGLADRARAVGGDFLHDSLPTGADLISLVRVIHDHDDPVALRILRAVHAVLPPGGTVLIAEPMSDTAGAQSVAAYFSFYLLAMGSGRPRSAQTLAALLRDAGFDRVRFRRTRQPLLSRLVTARRP